MISQEIKEKTETLSTKNEKIDEINEKLYRKPEMEREKLGQNLLFLLYNETLVSCHMYQQNYLWNPP